MSGGDTPSFADADDASDGGILLERRTRTDAGVMPYPAYIVHNLLYYGQPIAVRLYFINYLFITANSLSEIVNPMP